MKTFSFQSCGSSLNSTSKADEIYNEIYSIWKSCNEVELDLTGMVAMSTICARKIFGKLYMELGEEMFYSTVYFVGDTPEMDTIIEYAIDWVQKHGVDND